MAETNIVAQIIERAEVNRWKGRVALREGKRAYRYGELADYIRSAAGALEELGIGRGDRVAVYSPDCLESALAILAIIYSGAIVMPVNELSAANDLRNRLVNAEASAILVHRGLFTVVDEIASEVPSLQHIVVLDNGTRGDFGHRSRNATPASNATALPVKGSIDEKDANVCILLYSASASNRAGAEGLRGVTHTFAALQHAFTSFGEGVLDLNETDRVFCTVRLSTAYGLGTGLLFPLLAGAQSYLMPEQAHSAEVFATVMDFAPSIFSATPSLYGQLGRDLQSDPSIWKPLGLPFQGVKCIAGAEDMPNKLIDMLLHDFGGIAIVGYGLTEAFQFIIAGVYGGENSSDLAMGRTAGKRPGNCGKVVAGAELRIVNDSGDMAGIDEIGTLQIRAESLSLQYWGSSSKLTEDGWFTTRDRFMVDAEQNYYHCGRVDHLFKVGGKWVDPGEVERALLANEAVWECAVIGAADEDGLVKPLAFVVANIGQEPGTALEKELRAYVKSELAPYKYPRWIEFIDELPKSAAGAILRYKLRDRLRQTRKRRRAETRG